MAPARKLIADIYKARQLLTERMPRVMANVKGEQEYLELVEITRK